MSESESHVCPNCSERSPAGYILCPYCGFDLSKLVRAKHRVRITFREKFSRIWRSLYDPRSSKRLFTEIGVNPDRLGAFITIYFLSVAYSVRIPVILSKYFQTSPVIIQEITFKIPIKQRRNINVSIGIATKVNKSLKPLAVNNTRQNKYIIPKNTTINLFLFFIFSFSPLFIIIDYFLFYVNF